MAITLIGNVKSSCTLKVLLTLAEKGITNYKFVSVDLERGEQKVPDVGNSIIHATRLINRPAACPPC